MNKICKMAVDTYGKESQINQAFETMGKLIVAINYFKKRKISTTEVLPEIAELFILCEQLCYIIEGTEDGVQMCKDIIAEKLIQQEKLLKRYIESANTQKS